MLSTYCGKSCDTCNYREALKCNGCKSGPGRELYGDCDIASCCRNNCYNQCMDCTNKIGCDTYNSATRKAYFRSISAETNQSQDAQKADRSRFLGPKVKFIFVLSILQIICNVISNDKVAYISMGIYLVGLILGLAVGIVYGIVLILMARESERFKIAGILYVASPILAIVMAFMGELMTVLGSIAIIIMFFVAMYQEIYGYSDTLSGINNSLSIRWQDIWKKFIIWIIVMLASLGVLLLTGIFGYLSLILGCIGMIVAAIALIVIGIMRIIAISDTANAFNNYTQFH